MKMKINFLKNIFEILLQTDASNKSSERLIEETSFCCIILLLKYFESNLVNFAK